MNKRIIKSNDEGGAGLSFNTVLYTGTNASQDISVGFTPDLVWIKGRTYSDSHALTDYVRGDKKWLGSNLTNSEYDYTANTFGISFIEGGFNNDGPDGSLIFNKSGEEYVAWCWKAGGAAVTNTDGTITSQVSANTEAGFSIVSLTIPNANTQSVGHGLDTAPSVIIMKARDFAESWLTYHSSIGLNKYLLLNSTSAEASYTGIWSDVNSSTFTTLYHDAIGSPTRDVIAYCFAEVAGFSKFGSYTGTGSAGNTVTLGFRPRWVMIKRTDSANSWAIIDSARDTSDPYSKILWADLADAEAEGGTTTALSFSDTGFSMSTSATGSSINASGGTYIYMAFANQF